MKIKALGQEQKITSSAVQVDTSEVTHGCSRSPDPGYMGNFFASSYFPPGPDVFSVIYDPCLETACTCVSLTLAHMTRRQAL